MKTLKKILIAILLFSSSGIYAQGLSDILKGLGNQNGVGDVLGSVIEGVFTKTNLTLEDLVGEYQSQGPAVTFKSENLLQKAGGIAGAAAIESKIKPYYEKYGLNSMVLTVTEDAAFTMQIKGIKLSGTVSKNEEEGTFNFNFKVIGISLGSFKAYIEKSGSSLKLMFDATKLKSFISAVAKFTGNSMASALSSILDSYEGACIGFKMVALSSGTSNQTTNDSTSNSGSSITNSLNTLKDILNKGK